MVTKGKVHSMHNRGSRRKSDYYQTPYSMTEQLLENENFNYDKTVLEPASGELAIFSVLSDKGFLPIHGDIKTGFDFLKRGNIMAFNDKPFDYIITNPPFSLASEFIQKSKDVATEKFAMLLPLNYLHGQKRYEDRIFTDENYPLTKVYVFTRYPMLTDEVRDDGKYNTGMMVYAWYVWENANHANFDYYNNIPQIKWIDNNCFVLKKGE